MLYKWMHRVTRRRDPDVIIRCEDGSPYLLRWWAIPRNRFFNIYLHKLQKSDDNRALHDHPWWSYSICVYGLMLEHLQDGSTRFIGEGDGVFRSAKMAHRLEHIGLECWTVFITGPRIRDWGFHCPDGWMDWRYFMGNGGCGER